MVSQYSFLFWSLTTSTLSCVYQLRGIPFLQITESYPFLIFLLFSSFFLLICRYFLCIRDILYQSYVLDYFSGHVSFFFSLCGMLSFVLIFVKVVKYVFSFMTSLFVLLFLLKKISSYISVLIVKISTYFFVKKKPFLKKRKKKFKDHERVC